MTAGGPSFDDRTRAGAEKFGPNHTTSLACQCASAQSPHWQAQGGTTRRPPGPHWRSSSRCRNLWCATHSTIPAKNAKSVVSKESRTRASCAKVCDLSTGLGPNLKAKLNTGFIKKSLNGYVYERDSRARGTVSTQSTPIRGPKSPRPAGAAALARLGGSSESATRPPGQVQKFLKVGRKLARPPAWDQAAGGGSLRALAPTAGPCHYPTGSGRRASTSRLELALTEAARLQVHDYLVGHWRSTQSCLPKDEGLWICHMSQPTPGVRIRRTSPALSAAFSL